MSKQAKKNYNLSWAGCTLSEKIQKQTIALLPLPADLLLVVSTSSDIWLLITWLVRCEKTVSIAVLHNTSVSTWPKSHLFNMQKPFTRSCCVSIKLLHFQNFNLRISSVNGNTASDSFPPHSRNSCLQLHFGLFWPEHRLPRLCLLHGFWYTASRT